MLVLSRHIGEAIQIGDSVTVIVTDVRRVSGDPTVRLGIEAPPHISIFRTELLEEGDGAPDVDDQ